MFLIALICLFLTISTLITGIVYLNAGDVGGWAYFVISAICIVPVIYYVIYRIRVHKLFVGDTKDYKEMDAKFYCLSTPIRNIILKRYRIYFIYKNNHKMNRILRTSETYYFKKASMFRELGNFRVRVKGKIVLIIDEPDKILSKNK